MKGRGGLDLRGKAAPPGNGHTLNSGRYGSQSWGQSNWVSWATHTPSSRQ